MKSFHALPSPLALLALAFAAGPLAAMAAPTQGAPNVLFIAVDDLNDWVEPLGGHPQVKTPNLNRLARRGTTFVNAHCQAPICNPSRCSLLTGLRPTTTGIYGMQPDMRGVAETKDAVTLPQAFRQAGYFAAASGKIFHPGSFDEKNKSAEFEVWQEQERGARPGRRIAKLPGESRAYDWGPLSESDEETTDIKIASASIEALRNAPRDRPFFIACGLRLPHVPLFAPQKWFDLYPASSVALPPVRTDDRVDTPLAKDPNEWTNLAGDPRLADMKVELARWIPKTPRPLAPNGSGRTIVYDPVSREAVWQGKKIVPADWEK